MEEEEGDEEGPMGPLPATMRVSHEGGETGFMGEVALKTYECLVPSAPREGQDLISHTVF